ncbi:restriction endonuclease subunit S, partial [Candidatus Gracilibacteria bacterium]
LNPLEDLKLKYADRVDFVFKKIKSNIQENQQLIELRDWLLPMLMNGQVSVK